MLLLFCLLIGYGVIRLWEDTTARWRHETPPRHEHRMERMRQRAAAGGKPPSSGFRRYVAGLADDVWSSAHEKRNLMADARRVRREEKAKRKAAKLIARERAKTEKALGFSATVPDEVDASPEPAPAGPADGPSAGPVNDAAGTPSSPSPTPAPPTSGLPQPSPTPSASSTASEPLEPVRFFAEVPQPGDDAELPRRTPFATPPEAWERPVIHPGGRPASTGTATRALADELAAKAAALETDSQVAASAAGEGAPYPMTAEQARIYDEGMASAKDNGATRKVLMDEHFSLPVEARADLLDAIRRIPGRSLTVPPGCEDVEALAVLAARHGDQLDVADIYRHYDDAGPEVQALFDRENRPHRIETPNPPDAGLVPGSEPDPQVREEDTGHPGDANAPISTPARTGNNVIPFPTVNPDAAHRAASKEYPIVNGEISGLDQSIQYAGDLVDYATNAQDGIVAAAPDPDALAQSCEQAYADLTRGGVRGETLAAVAEVQESVVGAAQAVKDALVKWEAAQAAARKLHAGLSEQVKVQEAYAATPDAGSREFVSNGV